MTTTHDNGVERLSATLSPCGTLALVAACPHCAGQHAHGWSGDPIDDAKPRRPMCRPDRAPTAQPYRIEVGE